VGSETTICGLVVEPEEGRDRGERNRQTMYPKSKSSTPNFEYSISTLRYMRDAIVESEMLELDLCYA
jgi:hypothetical protein